jgi:hypothetical protein
MTRFEYRFVRRDRTQRIKYAQRQNDRTAIDR